MNNIRKLIFLFISITSTLSAFSDEISAADSIASTKHRYKNFPRATAETIGTNLSIWAFDRFVLKGSYAYISFQTIIDNFRHGFDWDDDHLHTNMFDHPYNGSLFFNAGRSNGFNYWQSELFAIGGSAMWEMFMEREYPSTNDIIATPIGGAAIGEVLYRASDLILDERTKGVERFGRELAAFTIDPMRGISRLLNSRAWRNRSLPGRDFATPQLRLDLSLGCSSLSLFGSDHGNSAGALARINMEYGDKDAEATKVPYEYFTFLLELQAAKKQPLLNRAEITGRLISTTLIDLPKWNMNAGLYQHFDFFDTDTIHAERNKAAWFPCSVPYKLGVPACIGGGIMTRCDVIPRFSMEGFLHANGIMLCGILTDFYRDYHRNYNWGSGFSIKVGINLRETDARWGIALSNQFYRLYTWMGYDSETDWSLTPDGAPVDVQGDTSVSSFNHFEFSIDYKIWKHFFISATFDLYHRFTAYDRTVRGSYWISYKQFVKSDQFGCNLCLTYRL